MSGLWAGETRYTAKAAKVGRQVVWRVTQDTYIDHAGAETRIRVMVHLKPDLSILSGSYERKDHGASVSLAFSRSGAGLLVQRRRQKGEADATSDVLEMKADLRSTASLGALLLFLRAAPGKKGAVYALPWLSSADLLAPEYACPARWRLAPDALDVRAYMWTIPGARCHLPRRCMDQRLVGLRTSAFLCVRCKSRADRHQRRKDTLCSSRVRLSS